MASKNQLDCSKVERGVWLVKVPKYLSELWEGNKGEVVGVMKISEDTTGYKVTMTSKEGLLESAMKKNPAAIEATPHLQHAPKEHILQVAQIHKQNMVVLKEDKSWLKEDINIRSGKLRLDGRVVKRIDCRPNDDKYMTMKISQIQRHSQPKKFIRQLDRAEVKFKPISRHNEELSKLKQKKNGAKLTRLDEEVVRTALFHAFEKHQYYKLWDLQQLTQQPAGYLKDILQQIGNYNTAPPHKSLWELKPEYRDYSAKNKMF